MLVLTRKKEETILIGDDIEILIVDVGEDRVKIGINAPKNIKIVRKELLEQIKKENMESTEVKELEISKLTEFIKK